MVMMVRDLQIKQSSRKVTNFSRRHTRTHWRKDWDPTEPTATRPLAFTDHTGEDAITYFYTHDLTKNVCEVLSRDGSAVSVVTEYDYTPFGAVTSSNSTTANTIMFSSEVFDPETSLVYYNYRHYNPTDGRWISRDPIEENGGWNSYCFIRNNAICKVDFQGLAYSYCIQLAKSKATRVRREKSKKIYGGIFVDVWIGIVLQRKCYFRCYFISENNCPKIPCKNKKCELDHGVEELITVNSPDGKKPAPNCSDQYATILARGKSL